MRSRRNKYRNPDSGIWPYRNRMDGILCAHCGHVITGSEAHPGEVKAWERVAKKSANYHMACALELGKVVNREAYEKLLRDNPDLQRVELPPAPPAPHPAVMDDNFAPVDIDGPEVSPDDPELDEEADEPAPVNGHGPVQVVDNAPVLPDWLQGMAQAILPYLEAKIAAKADKAEILALIEKYAIKREVIEIHDRPKGEIRRVDGHHHPMFKRLLQQLEGGMNTQLVGPPASGKTTEAMNAGEVLGFRVYLQGPVSTEYGYLGYCDGPGVYHATPFQQWFVSPEPALLVWDEADANESNAVLQANPALENGVCNFPYTGELVRRGNARSVAVSCVNTWGLGATDDFVGRCRQDAAALDRWAPIPWDYDAEYERYIAGNDAWVTRVQTVRANARRKGLQVVISPRASIRGAKKLAWGWPQDLVEQTEIRKGMSDTDWRSIQ